MLLNLVFKLLNIEFVSNYWPSIFIVTGFILLWTIPHFAPQALIVMLLGLFLVAVKNGWLNSSVGQYVEVLVVISLGLLLTMKVGEK